MIGIGRRTGVAALLVSTMLSALSGCMSVEQNQAAHQTTAGYGNLTRSAEPTPLGAAAGLPNSPTAVAAAGQTPMSTAIPMSTSSGSSPIQQASFNQPAATVPPQAMPIDAGKAPPMVINPGLPGSPGNPIPGPGPIPTELAPVSHPPYTIAPPDIITIDAIRLIPKPPYRVEPLEVLLINVTDTLPNQAINGPFVVTPDGTINLGFNYGTVRVAGLTLEQIQTTIRNHLGNILRNAQVTVALAQFRGLQQLRGEHLVRPDGTISLGSYGSVYVAGMSLGQAKCVIEKYLSEYLLNPQIAIDVFAYNSKVFYVIFDGGGFGQRVIRLPVTGNETVLDAIGYVQGLAPVSSTHRIWLARPSPVHNGCNQILPVDWKAITMAGSTATNYQIFPGDRVYVSADCLITFDNYLSKVLAPVERVLGVTLLGTSVAQNFQNLHNGTGTGTGTAVVVP
jgi:polysaccharide export outer membrane protein